MNQEEIKKQLDDLFLIDGEESGETPWEFDTVSEVTDFDMGEALHGHYRYKEMAEGLIARARSPFPIWFRIDKNALEDCDYMEFKIESDGTIEVWKHKEGK